MELPNPSFASTKPFLRTPVSKDLNTNTIQQILQEASSNSSTLLKFTNIPSAIREILYAPPCPNESIAKLLEVALVLHNNGDYQRAIDVYIRAQREWFYAINGITIESSSILNDESKNNASESNTPKPISPNSSRPSSAQRKTSRPSSAVLSARLRAQNMEPKQMSSSECIYFRLAIGSVYESCHNDDLALAEYLEAKRYAKMLSDTHPDKALVFSCVGCIYIHLYNSNPLKQNIQYLENALAHFQQALDWRREGMEELPSLKVDIAVLLNNMGVCKHIMGIYLEALRLYEESVTLLRSEIKEVLHPRIAICLRNLEKLKNCMQIDTIQKPTFQVIKIPITKKETKKKGGKKKGGKKKKK